ncbi:MAG TPA: ANTAR domain-containing protein [Streptosporangiaceae bacterium]|nr:ANTAR domain-containing protein [Streptosporangiaceae bacterium]
MLRISAATAPPGVTEVAVQQNVAQEIAREAAELLSIADASESRSLYRLAVLATRQVPACSGATSAVWRHGEVTERAATHPDLAELFELALRAPESPWADALADGHGIACPDTVAEERWPEYAAAALSWGVRCFVTLVHASGPMAVTLTLFSVRPGSLDAEQVALAELLVAFAAAVMGNASVYRDSLRTTLQLRDAVDARMVVDQAKGILMHALDCTAQDAFDRMRAISQARKVKVSEVAGKIVEAHLARQT